MTAALRSDADAVARQQFFAFDRMGNDITLGDEERRRMLRLSARQWRAWSGLRAGGVVPGEPVLPVMLRRLGEATHRLAVAAERMGEVDSGERMRARRCGSGSSTDGGQTHATLLAAVAPM